MRRILSSLLVTAAAVLLGACSTVRTVDNDVRSFSTLPAVPVGTAYRFERLPSQKEMGAPQEQLEAMAQQALAKVGLQRNDAAAKYSVQIGARVQRDAYAPWETAWPGGFGWNGLYGRDYFVTRSGRVVWSPHPGFGPWGPWPGWNSMDTPYYRREVSVVMRDVATSQIVYETHAAHDGRWSDTGPVLAAMFDAALQGFPQPPSGLRRVDTQIAR